MYRCTARTRRKRRRHRGVSQPHEFFGLQQTGNRDIFVDCFPMDADSTANELPLFPLLTRRIQEPWELYQGNRHASPVVQNHRQLIVGARHVDGHGFTAFHF
jgi:hypothetical protein